MFSATLSTTTIALSDGTTFLADSPTLTANLAPSSGASLVAGTDFVVLSITGTVSSVPEPASCELFLLGGLTLIPAARWRRRARHRTQ
jgi:hypothetical protein